MISVVTQDVEKSYNFESDGLAGTDLNRLINFSEGPLIEGFDHMKVVD
jgi:hypothetical protein